MNMSDMHVGTYPNLARRLVFKYIKNTIDPTEYIKSWFTLNHVYVVDSAFVLDNFTCTLHTIMDNEVVYRVIYNQKEDVWHLDTYKRSNQAIYRFDESGNAVKDDLGETNNTSPETDLMSRFDLILLDDDTSLGVHNKITDMYKNLVLGLNKRLTHRREKSLAITKLEESLFWAHKALSEDTYGD